jgi:nucleoid-associated protein YgaU
VLDKAKITGNGHEVRFQFNPETLSFTKKVTFEDSKTQSSENAPIRQFIGTDPVVLSLKMILDDTVGEGPSVADRVNQLLAWTNPADDSDPPHPHELTFDWGQLKIGSEGRFPCHLESVQVEYTLFTDAGVPIRASATVVLKGMPTKKYGQNPTSGGLHAKRSRRLRRGDDLAVIAHQEYGTGAVWRVLAEVNGIDNPFRLPVGRELVLPDRSEITSLQRLGREVQGA